MSGGSEPVSAEVVVRLANPADVPGIARCHVASWREAYADLVPKPYLDALDVRVREQRWRVRLSTPGSTAAVALLDGTVVGHAYVSRCVDQDCPTRFELRMMYVRAGMYGTGTARRLLDLALGERSACLWVFTANARAQAFYAKQGFVADGRAKIDEDTGVAEIRLAC